MTRSRTIPLLAFIGLVLTFIAYAGLAMAAVREADEGGGAQALRERFESMRLEREASPFGRPMRIDSRDADGRLGGEVFALVRQPFARVEQALHEPRQWCEVMLLPFNTTHCAAQPGDAAQGLALFIARRKGSDASDSYKLDFRFRVDQLAPDYMRIRLNAREGPFGTRDYRIALEAAPLDGERTLVRLSYAYGYGAMSRMAMQTYLSTWGASKVGFSSERDDEGRPTLVKGMRGVVERNTMRYFLAIEAYLDSLSAPPDQRLDRRLRLWFDATERFPRQLHEMERDEYLAMKRAEYRQMQAAL